MRDIMFKTGENNIIIFRKQEELVYTSTHMCYPETDNIENVHSKKYIKILLFII